MSGLQILCHITFNEVAVVVGVFLLGFAAGAAVVWQMIRGRLGE